MSINCLSAPLPPDYSGSAAANSISQYSLAVLLFVYIVCKGLHKATWDGEFFLRDGEAFEKDMRLIVFLHSKMAVYYSISLNSYGSLLVSNIVACTTHLNDHENVSNSF